MEQHKGLLILTLAAIDQWDTWLAANGEQTTGVWVKLSKKGAAAPTITYEQARNMAIAYGWIDGLVNALDKEYYAIRFTPRRPNGVWSKINRGVAEGLITAKHMKPAGQAQVDAAMADGRWEAAYDGAATIQLPDDFKTALQANPKAKAFFAVIDKTNRYAFLWRVHTARNPKIRAKRIDQYVTMLAEGSVFHPK